MVEEPTEGSVLSPRRQKSHPVQIHYLVFVWQANTFFRPCTNICLYVGKYILEKLRNYLSVVGRYFFENPRKYLSGGKYFFEKLRKYLSVGKYFFENLRKYKNSLRVFRFLSLSESVYSIISKVWKIVEICINIRRRSVTIGEIP